MYWMLLLLLVLLLVSMRAFVAPQWGCRQRLAVAFPMSALVESKTRALSFAAAAAAAALVMACAWVQRKVVDVRRREQAVGAAR